ncbi:LapA family protein [Streptomyces turgidiscabies]|uniref:Lipopolysaccharide assembly protein A domain-containing protein n=1 Tax=Streptomyces turgidiscabies (strain Car8) TaxID=698760 RepID=L7F912_STRT8|nr:MULTISPECIES: LapA family protein [Streptomyces]ELP67541.1 hypothetical protein STRTUCAR8_08842 [Streptomyces turgidiscabies Car8]MDX3491200.1 LapA family protein [Streptomyces turgidiscabies]GAQ73053.1 hypothetical protein T45_04809 [Streptomyces turgidiscabies]
MSPKTFDSGGKAGGNAAGTRGLLTPVRVAVGALALLALIFIFENTRATRIRLLIPEVTMPLWMALLGTAVIGALCGAYFMRRRR